MTFKTQPFKHQKSEWEYSRELATRAIFWEQGTGKSKLTIDTLCHLYMRGLIDAVLVVAPNGVHRNWVEQELPAHLWDDVAPNTQAFAYSSDKAGAQHHKKSVERVIQHVGLSILAMSYDAVMTKAGKDYLNRYFKQRKILYVLDEAHYIKNPSAARTKTILKSAKFAPFRRVLTGTPIANGAFDAYPLIKFLEPDYWKALGFATFTEFKHYFGIWQKQRLGDNDKREFEVLVAYRHLDELQNLMKPIASRVTKDDVLDLPPKLYQKRIFQLNPEQARLYSELKNDFMAWLSSPAKIADANCPQCKGAGEIIVDSLIYPCGCAPVGDISETNVVIAELAITRLLRLQQVTCGYVPPEDNNEPMHMIQGTNKRLEALLNIVEQTQHKVIVWARFQLDIDLIMQALEKAGVSAVRYDGRVTETERSDAIARFKGKRPIFVDGVVSGYEPIEVKEHAKVFVGNPAVGATGLTLTEAKTVVYYSNNFKLIDRLQSEDRAHRIGQDNPVLYVDLIAENTVDEKIVQALREKLDIASQITGDEIKEWL